MELKGLLYCLKQSATASMLNQSNPIHTLKPFTKIQFIIIVTPTTNAGVAQSVQCLITDRTAGVRFPTEAQDFSSSLCVQTGSGAHPASCTMGTGGSFRGG
jgi:hypothetical protein